MMLKIEIGVVSFSFGVLIGATIVGISDYLKECI